MGNVYKINEEETSCAGIGPVYMTPTLHMESYTVTPYMVFVYLHMCIMCCRSGNVKVCQVP